MFCDWCGESFDIVVPVDYLPPGKKERQQLSYCADCFRWLIFQDSD